jgi:GNAT superfamily N-acetyltransferase
MNPLRFEKLDSENFVFFEGLMRSDSLSSDCFCLSHRVEPQDVLLGKEACEKMRRLTDKKKVHGLLAFYDSEAIAWAGIEPFPDLVGHEAYEALSLEPEQFSSSDWVIHCLFVRKSFRTAPSGRDLGVLDQLVRAACQYATDRGARRILALPWPDTDHTKNPQEKYMGSEAGYQRLGFRPLRQISEKMLILEKSSLAPRLTAL